MFENPVQEKADNSMFQDFLATELYCPKCRVAMPVREKLLLYLPHGELHEFLCRRCGSSLGTREKKTIRAIMK